MRFTQPWEGLPHSLLVRRRALAVSWLCGSATGVLLGLFGVQLVTSGITAGRVTPLSRPEVLAALQASSNTTPEHEDPTAVPGGVAPTPGTVPSPGAGAEAPLPDPAPSSDRTPPASPPPRPGSPSGKTQPPASPAATPASVAPPAPAQPAAPETTTTTLAPAPADKARPPRTTRTTRPAPTTTTVPPTTAPPSATDKRPGEQDQGKVQTISSQGGTVAVRYLDGDRVKLLWARPNAGYDVNVVSDGSRLVHVRFSNDRHRSTVTAWWKDGAPAQYVQETDAEASARYRTQTWSWWSR